MKKLSIDLETYSSVDLGKSGVYKYAESEDFEILLFAYSIDDGGVKVIDLSNGEIIPEEILSALSDKSIEKWAFNASFERVCLSRFLGKRLKPQGWYCTMIWSAYLGLPLSLEKVGEVLKLDKQKMNEGKALIRYFSIPCKPTKTNGMRTRNLPHHDLEKWSTFKEYNQRDVETEMEIKKKLSAFPMPQSEWENYWVDQNINDRGILIDEVLVDSAIKFDEILREENMDRAIELTGLENPNSPMQLKEWLNEKGLEIDSLAKKDVESALKNAEGDIKEVLELRQELSKSSVRKYDAMKNVKGNDKRVRGLLQFYGANRTGRYCLTGDHEVLTDKGWVRLDKWNGGNIACWNTIGEKISFQKSEMVKFPFSGQMVFYEDKRISQISTTEHKMYFKNHYKSEWRVGEISEMLNYAHPAIPFTGYRQVQSNLDHIQLRVLIMIQADGHYTAEGNIKLSFSKLRKVERCKSLLRKAEICFNLKEYMDKSKKRYVFTIYSRHLPLWLRMFENKTFDTWLFDESADVFFDELVHWDGYQSAKNSIQYSTVNRKNADIIQAFAHLSGRACQMSIKKRSQVHNNWQDAYILDIWLRPKNAHQIQRKAKKIDYTGMVYCAMTPTGFFLVRRNGRVWVTGNSGRLIQVQNLRRNNLQDLDLARSLVRNKEYESLEMLYDSPSDVLSQLIRTAFIPKEGCRFIVSDFSAIEARVLAWLAGEDWVLNAFKNGEDIYCSTASQMFGVPVVKHGVNGDLRQKGKVATLACGYGGSVGALKAMGAIEMGLSEDELQSIVDSWREANPNIVSLWWDIDSVVKRVVKTRSKEEYKNLVISYEKGILFIELPSKRRLAYPKAKIGMNRFGGESIVYEGIVVGNKWDKIESYGGKFVENIVQAIARDILAEAMMRLEKKGFNIVMHIHDEVVIESDSSSIEEINEIMSLVPSWAPGLILDADGFESEFYKKD
ncbi:DNA polymerase [Anaerococcus prevotii]|uniref:DNA-directed DNA polymerase n=1 Tax=Anaerococcus prevotii ACS-065-V-Col13 TaxID=879305 RepID=F0GWG8_9FIRM|nr:DNA polymerase [Anaerococcus prevotii]EGC81771.1 DNA-directed DNA polymerase [Anaerococcus prevotii ACS-065-V-Col13]